jgi:hypothetical protein
MTTAIDPRSPEARQQAERALEDAEADAAAADAAVNDVRERFALGRAKRGDVLKASRVLANSIETREVAKAAIRGLDRAASELRAAEQAERESRRLARARELRVERDELYAELAAWFAETEQRAAALNQAAADWNARASREGGAVRLAVPSDSGRMWGAFTDGLAQLRRNWPVRGDKT